MKKCFHRWDEVGHCFGHFYFNKEGTKIELGRKCTQCKQYLHFNQVSQIKGSALHNGKHCRRHKKVRKSKRQSRK